MTGEQIKFTVRFTGEEELRLYEWLREKSFETGIPIAELLRAGAEYMMKQANEIEEKE